jgi:hypothetical protein
MLKCFFNDLANPDGPCPFPDCPEQCFGLCEHRFCTRNLECKHIMFLTNEQGLTEETKACVGENIYGACGNPLYQCKWHCQGCGYESDPMDVISREACSRCSMCLFRGNDGIQCNTLCSLPEHKWCNLAPRGRPHGYAMNAEGNCTRCIHRKEAEIDNYNYMTDWSKCDPDYMDPVIYSDCE